MVDNKLHRKLMCVRIEADAYVLSKLSQDQIKSIVRLAESYNPERLTIATDIFSEDNILFMIGTAGLNGLIEQDGSVHT